MVILGHFGPFWAILAILGILARKKKLFFWEKKFVFGKKKFGNIFFWGKNFFEKKNFFGIIFFFGFFFLGLFFLEYIFLEKKLFFFADSE